MLRNTLKTTKQFVAFRVPVTLSFIAAAEATVAEEEVFISLNTHIHFRPAFDGCGRRARARAFRETRDSCDVQWHTKHLNYFQYFSF